MVFLVMSLGNRYVFKATTSTPLIVGWYEPLRLDPHGIRATEIKGLWRWWARAFVAGALYDLSYVQGRGSADVLLRPTREEAERVNHVVGRVLGLGYAGEEGAEASRFVLYTEYAGRGSLPVRCSSDGLQRIRLLALKKSVCYYPQGTPFNIVAEKRVSRDSYAELTALKILAIALQLSGLGSGGRRGLGSVDAELPSEVSAKNLRQLIDDVYQSCVELVKRVASEKHWSSASSAVAAPPPLPALSRKNFMGFPVAQVLVARGVEFRDVHNFFVRSERCRVLAGSPICNDDLRSHLDAWILGLPRGRRGDRRSTGYTIPARDISRRASPILISYHRQGNALGDGAYITVLLSGDWPSKIVWSDATSQSITLDFARLRNAYDRALNEFTAYLQKVGAKVSRVWP